MIVVRVLRALSGALTAGVVLLTLAIVGAAYLGAVRGFPGPGIESIVWHVVSAILVVIAQRLADHRGPFGSLLGSVLVVVITCVLLWTQWWT